MLQVPSIIHISILTLCSFNPSLLCHFAFAFVIDLLGMVQTIDWSLPLENTVNQFSKLLTKLFGNLLNQTLLIELNH